MRQTTFYIMFLLISSSEMPHNVGYHIAAEVTNFQVISFCKQILHSLDNCLVEIPSCCI